MRFLRCLIVAWGALLAVSAEAQPLPTGTVSCDIAGMSMDADRKGLAVRAEPDAKARIVGRLAPPQRATKQDIEDTVYPGDKFWRTEFKIIGMRDDWVLIDQAMHPYNDPTRSSDFRRRSTGGVKTYAGQGWIPLKGVGGKLTFWRHRPETGLYKEPDEKAERLPAKNALGDPLRGGNSPKRLITCQGEWAKVESHDGVIGWWQGYCGQPYSDCDR
jgi:hypothetical protein